MKHKLIIFDCDGILVDSEPISNRLFTDMVNELGPNLSYAESKRLFTGRSDDDCVEIVSGLGALVPEGFLDDFNLRLIELLKQKLKPVKNIKKILEYIKFQSKDDVLSSAICVASNAPERKVRTSLRITGLDVYFGDNIFTSQDVKRGKPFPDLYLFVARQMGVSPNDCAVVEDSVFGVRAAIAAGMDVFGYTERIDEHLLKNEGAVTFDNMLDLLKKLKESGMQDS